MNRALATVDLGAVRHNVASLKSLLPKGNSLMAVVKANGYGHGAVPVAQAGLKAGVDVLGVATVTEARELRDAGLNGRLVILGPLTGVDLAQAFDLNVEIVIWSYPFLGSLVKTGHAKGNDISVHVKLDTGMHRLGLYPRDLPGYLDAIETEPEVALAGVMTHFATADEEDEDFFRYQLRSFEEAVQVVLRTGTKVQFHCANSAATIRHPESHFDMVRCGIAVYGLSPFQGSAESDGLKPALRLTSYIADIKELIEGDTVGYGRSWTTGRRTHIGVIPIGYADGVSRLLSNRGQVLAGGKPYSMVGRVSMDQITVDLGSEPLVKTGDEAVLIGSQREGIITAEEVAGLQETINYEVTCSISPRVERRYVE